MEVLLLCTLFFLVFVLFLFTVSANRHTHRTRHSVFKVYILVKQSTPTEHTESVRELIHIETLNLHNPAVCLIRDQYEVNML